MSDEEIRELQEDAILALLRLKRKKKREDLDLTKDIHELQRKLEEDLGVYGCGLAPEHDVDRDWEPVER